MSRPKDRPAETEPPPTPEGPSTIVERAVPPALLTLEPPPALAPHGRSRDQRPTRDFLLFWLADEVYGLPLGAIHEILRMPTITEVPRAPHDVLGIISVRGAITTVIDLRRRLRVADAAPDAGARILLTKLDGETIGLLVDRVEHVERLAEAQIELRSTLHGDTSDFILGIGRRDAAPAPDGASATRRKGAAPKPSPALVRADASRILILLDADAVLRGRR